MKNLISSYNSSGFDNSFSKYWRGENILSDCQLLDATHLLVGNRNITFIRTIILIYEMYTNNQNKSTFIYS